MKFQIKHTGSMGVLLLAAAMEASEAQFMPRKLLISTP